MAEDPVERSRRLAASQSARQDQNEAGRREWMEKLPGFAKYLQAVVAPLKAEHGVIAGIFGAGLQVRFDMRFAGADENGRWQHEDGAEARFVFGRDGQVHGFRCPAHIAGTQVPMMEFVALGRPADVDNNAIGNAVADFLEWGAAGEGRSRFVTPL
jgi:hypothetical protein